MKCVLRRLQISLRKYQNTAAIMQLQILKTQHFCQKMVLSVTNFIQRSKYEFNKAQV